MTLPVTRKITNNLLPGRFLVADKKFGFGRSLHLVPLQKVFRSSEARVWLESIQIIKNSDIILQRASNPILYKFRTILLFYYFKFVESVSLTRDLYAKFLTVHLRNFM